MTSTALTWSFPPFCVAPVAPCLSASLDRHSVPGPFGSGSGTAGSVGYEALLIAEELVVAIFKPWLCPKARVWVGMVEEVMAQAPPQAAAIFLPICFPSPSLGGSFPPAALALVACHALAPEQASPSCSWVPSSALPSEDSRLSELEGSPAKQSLASSLQMGKQAQRWEAVVSRPQDTWRMELRLQPGLLTSPPVLFPWHQRDGVWNG